MRPSHPGSILAGMIEGLREESEKSYPVDEIVSTLGISAATLSAVLNQDSGIDEKLAARLAASFEISQGVRH